MSSHDFATDADVEAERAILAMLHSARPHDDVLGEETGRSGVSGSDRIWLVDPLCGTLNYAARMPLFALNVALRIGPMVKVAAVADPFADEIFWTDGTAAQMRAAGNDRPLRPDARSRLVDLNLDPPFPNESSFRAVTLAAHREFVAAFRPRVVSTSLALTWVATGQRAAYVTDGDMRGDNVHFAAGIAICAAAGCMVTNLVGGEHADGATGLLVAADRATHEALLRLVPVHGERN